MKVGLPLSLWINIKNQRRFYNQLNFTMKKILKYLLITLLLLLIGGYFYIQRVKKAALPDYNKSVKITALTNQVKVYRDAHGVPHIVAQNEHDLYMAVGYLSAQDRLWQMDLLRRVTQGRLSEIFGKKLIDTDVLLRKLRMPETSKKLYGKLDEKVKKPLDYFAQGVNSYIKDHKDDLPFEFKVLGYQPENWRPQESLNLVGFMAWNLELGYKMEALLQMLKGKVSPQQLAELLPDYKVQKTYVYPSFHYPVKMVEDTVLVAALNRIGSLAPDIFNGSNNWAVSGKKSTTGKPIFSNDMHLGLDIPGIWTRMQLTIPGKLNVTGVILPGEPFVVAGHNTHIAWGMTNVMLDGADFYIETLNPKNQAQYKFNGQWRNMTVKKEKIYVKGQKEPIEKTLYFTHRGPIFTSFDDVKVMPVSMHWIGNEDSREIEALYRLSTAQNWSDFTQAIKGFKSVSQNIAYADVAGNIGIHMTGRLPERLAPGYLFYPGDTDKYDWKKYVPFDSLPFEYNPERGFVSSANNKSVDNSYPYYITEWYDLPYRIKRIRQMLTAKDRLSTEDFRQMLFDHHSVQADEIKPILLKHLAQVKDFDPSESAAFKDLQNWNNVYDLKQAAPAIFDQTLIDLIKNLVSDEMGQPIFKIFNASLLSSKYLVSNVFEQDNSAWADNIKTKEKESFHQIVVQSFKDAVKDLKAKYGAVNQWHWGDIHHLKLVHPLGKVKILDRVFDLNRTYPAPGGINTVNPFTYPHNQAFDANMGASEKHIFNTADWDGSYTILPTGISGNPASPFYCDQTKDYIRGKVYPDYFTPQSFKKHAKFTMILNNK